MMELYNYFSDPNEAVLTTLFVLNKDEQITRIYHHLEDGMWEFVGDTEAAESDYRVVSIQEMVNLDNSILSVSNMEPGYFAHKVVGNNTFFIEKIRSDC
ncbi:hypothetical protein [Sphingobacterium spiritivorum]|uniref:hypothetical protein n=1 Tax=Sphingobacterium spiritivorum TaxID=258 RepID=UPI00191A6F79|nr:hypothetical protein [Sphingobacterium spiritivorum]QQT24844.1 hypothetical protein I6J02_14020 [Sphingobacterium spiritivorum]